MTAVDLRSDTVTRPSAEMRSAMAAAEVGDDGFGEDPTVHRLEERFAEIVGTEAAVFVPSGVMGNQIALRLLGGVGTRVVIGERQHVVIYEQGAAAVNGSYQLHPVADVGGVVAAADVEWAIAAQADHQPTVAAVCVENTHMPSGGVPLELRAVQGVASLGLPVHMDGARLFNAAVAAGVDAKEYVAPVSTVMSCLSKGLGAPVGSMLAGSADLIGAARVERKRLGGAMRQVGVLAAAGLIALGNIDRLADDHARARRLADAVRERWPGALRADQEAPDAPTTNIVVFDHPAPAELLEHLRDNGVLGETIAPGVARLVTHLDVDDAGIDRAVTALRAAPGPAGSSSTRPSHAG